MTNSTLGGLIKDYRIQKGISQLDIAFELGWKEPSRLSRIEQGKTEKPPRELINRIISAIGLEESEKNMLLLTGSYLPTDEEIEKIRRETKPLLDNWQFPATVFDFSWRCVSQNNLNVKAYGQTPKQTKFIEDFKPRVLDIIFNVVSSDAKPEVVDTKMGEEWVDFLKTLIINFKYEQRYRTREKWYIEHVRELMKNELFRNLWVDIHYRDKLKGIVGKFARKSLTHPQDRTKILNFNLVVLPVLKDPRFEIETLIPADLETHKYFQK